MRAIVSVEPVVLDMMTQPCQLQDTTTKISTQQSCQQQYQLSQNTSTSNCTANTS